MRDVDVDLAAGFEVRGREFLGLVVAFGPPCYVVGVAEGVDVEDVDVGWGEEDVLDELRRLDGLGTDGRGTYTGEHVPRVEEDQRCNKPHHVSCG